MPVLSWLLLVVAVVVGAFAGGMGGRAVLLRVKFAALWEAIDAIEERLNRRKGQDLTRARLAQPPQPDKGLALLKGLLSGRQAAPTGPLDELEMQRRAAAQLREEEKKGA